jgi:hypothetical protein
MSDEITLDSGDEISLAADDIQLQADDPEAEGAVTPEEAEAMAAAEVNEVLSGFKARARQEDQRFEDATDSEYWVCLCFQTRDQKEEFLRKKGWLDLGDKYLDGMMVAEEEGITLESRIPPLPELTIDRRYTRLAMQ